MHWVVLFDVCCGIGSLGELGIVCTPHCMWSFLWQLLLLSFTCEDFAANYFVGCFVFNECRSRKHGSAPWVWASGTNIRVVLFDFVKKTLDQRTFTTFFVTIELGGTICTIHTNDAGSHGIGTFGAVRYTACSHSGVKCHPDVFSCVVGQIGMCIAAESYGRRLREEENYNSYWFGHSRCANVLFNYQMGPVT